MKDLIHVLENFVGGQAATTIASQMRQWGKRVPSAAPSPPKPSVEYLPAVVPAATSLSIAGFEIKQDAQGRYCLNDLHKASGGAKKHQIGNWMRLQQTEELIKELAFTTPQIRGVKQIQPVGVFNGGKTPGTYVCKELVYAYAMWISPSFSLKVIRAYDALVTGQLSPPTNDTQLLLSEALEIQKRMTSSMSALMIENKGLSEEVQEVQHKLNKMKVFTVDQVVQYIRTIECADLTADKLSNILALYGYLTPMRRVPARKKWGERWFEYGLVDVINQDGQLWFVGKDVAEALGYTDCDQAIRKHCKSIKTSPVESTGQVRHVSIIPERDMYCLVIQSNLPTAERFEEWVVGDVLPTICKTGSYTSTQYQLPQNYVEAVEGLLAELKTNAILIEDKKQLEGKLEAQQPKVAVYDHITDSTYNFSMREAAKFVERG